MADMRAEALLQQRDGAQRCHNLLGRRRARLAGAELPKRAAEHRAVLTYLEVREVKTEGLRLPDQVVQLAVCLARCPGRDQRTLQSVEVVEQLVRPRVRE